MYSEAPKPAVPDEKFEEEEIVLTNDKELHSDPESDNEEVYHSRSTSKKQSNKQPVSKRTAPISVYTYKVNDRNFSVSQA